MKKIAIALMLIFLAVQVMAANTVVTTLYGVTITDIDSDYTTGTPVRVWSIKFYPSAITDYVTIKLSTDAGQVITVLRNTISLDPVIEYFPPDFRATLVLDYSDSSIDTGADARVVILYRR